LSPQDHEVAFGLTHKTESPYSLASKKGLLIIYIHRGEWQGQCYLDGEPVSFISSRLDIEPESQPKQLSRNLNKSFQGSIVRGIGFVIEPLEAEQLMAQDSINQDWLLPYITGEDLNSRPDQSASCQVICFYDWPIEKAQS
jgi:hypothetical protein